MWVAGHCFAIFFRRLANFVAGFLGPWRAFLVIVTIHLLPILPATSQSR